MTGRTARGPKRRPGFKVQKESETASAVVERVDQVPDPRTTAPTSAPDVIRNQCTAHKRDGSRCRKSSIIGANVCGKHGGSAPQVKKAARVRLAMAADDLMGELIRIALSGQDEGTRLRGVTAALDRGGFGPGTSVEVTHELRPFEQLLTRIERGGPPAPSAPRAALQRATDEDDDVVDVEVVEDPPAPAPVARRANGKRIPAARVEPLMTFEEAFDAPTYDDPHAARVTRGI